MIEELRQFVDTLDEAEYVYGGDDYELTDEDLKLLMEGKILNIGINCNEYGITIRIKK